MTPMSPMTPISMCIQSTVTNIHSEPKKGLNPVNPGVHFKKWSHSRDSSVKWFYLEVATQSDYLPVSMEGQVPRGFCVACLLPLCVASGEGYTLGKALEHMSSHVIYTKHYTHCRARATWSYTDLILESFPTRQLLIYLTSANILATGAKKIYIYITFASYFYNPFFLEGFRIRHLQGHVRDRAAQHGCYA